MQSNLRRRLVPGLETSRALFSLIGFLLCLSPWTGAAQNLAGQGAIDPSDPRVKALADQYRKGTNVSSNPLADSAMSMDTVGLATDSTQELSAFENMLRGTKINPDSMIRTLTIFGHDVFAKSRPSTFAASDRFAVPASYPVGTGDEIIVMLWGRINEENRVRVDRDGKITLPRIGPVSVGGMSFGAMEKNILDRVNAIEGVQASVTMGELRPIQVYIVGEVRSPGVYTVSALSNVTNALFAAGGPTRKGSLRNIQLKRNGTVVANVDFYDFLLSGSNNTGVRLAPGDVIMVPVAGAMAAVVGNVRRGAIYELKGATDLEGLIKLAGGITPAAWVNKIQVERFAENDRRVVLDLETESSKKMPDFAITDGDLVKIFPVVVRDENAVYASGNVQRPGKFEYHEGMKVTDVIADYRALLPETYFDYAVIKRQSPPHFRESLVPFNLKAALDNKESAENVALQPRDHILVFHRDYFEPNRAVAIAGAVNKAGTLPLLENMTVRDLIVQAGGLSEDASPEFGELYRRTYDKENVKTAKTEFCVKCALENDPQHNLSLEKSDRVFIRTKKGWQDERRIVLKGEVVFPGEYVLLEGETLANLIDRAGGFTEDAYLAGTVFTRLSVRRLEKQRVDDYARQLETDMMNLTAEMAAKEKTAEAQALLAQQAALLARLRDVQPAGRVVVDLTSRPNYENLMLEDGDELTVPKRMSTVSVIGEVFNPATFTLSLRPQSVSRYVQMAGGYKEHSDTKNVYVVKANGSVMTQKMVNIRAYHLEPGDVVVVPQRIRYVSGYKIFIDSISAIIQVATLAALIGTLVVTLNKQ